MPSFLFFWKVERDANCRPLLFVLGDDNFAAVAFFLWFFLEGKRGRQLPSPSFCFVLLQQEEEEGDGNFVAIAFFFGIFWNT
jgi:hypothetical protein